MKIPCGHMIMNYKWAQLGSNQRPTSYEPAALTAELWALAESIIPCLTQVVKGGILYLSLFSFFNTATKHFHNHVRYIPYPSYRIIPSDEQMHNLLLPTYTKQRQKATYQESTPIYP